MASEIDIFMEMAGNELRLAKALFLLSSKEKNKLDLEANAGDTFKN